MAGDSQGLRPTNWRIAYRAALREANDSVLPKRISDAEEAIVQRTQEIFRETGVDAVAEREATMTRSML